MSSLQSSTMDGDEEIVPTTEEEEDLQVTGQESSAAATVSDHNGTLNGTLSDDKLTRQLAGGHGRQANLNESTATQVSDGDGTVPRPPKRPIIREDYFNIDEIVALNTRVTCILTRPGPGLGILDPGLQVTDLEAGSKLDLPLYLAKELHAKGQVTMEPPRAFSEKYREILEADATIVDLHALNENFYLTGKLLTSTGVKEAEEISASLVDTYRQRARLISAHSLASDGRETLAVEGRFKNLLDNMEFSIYDDARRANINFRRWTHQDLEASAEASQMVQNLRNRQRIMELRGLQSTRGGQPSSSSSSQTTQ